MATATRERRLPPALPLATLIDRELRVGGSERLALRYGHAGFTKRGEDNFLVKPDCLGVPGDPTSAFSVFVVFDGHNGMSATVYSKKHLLEHVMSALPPDIDRDDWLQALPRVLVAGFVKATRRPSPTLPDLAPPCTQGDDGCGRREEGEVVAVAATAEEEQEQEQEGEREREDEQRVVGAAEATAAGVEVVRRGLGVRLGLLVVGLRVLDNHGLETRSSWHRGRA